MIALILRRCRIATGNQRGSGRGFGVVRRCVGHFERRLRGWRQMQDRLLPLKSRSGPPESRRNRCRWCRERLCWKYRQALERAPIRKLTLGIPVAAGRGVEHHGQAQRGGGFRHPTGRSKALISTCGGEINGFHIARTAAAVVPDAAAVAAALAIEAGFTVATPALAWSIKAVINRGGDRGDQVVANQSFGGRLGTSQKLLGEYGNCAQLMLANDERVESSIGVIGAGLPSPIQPAVVPVVARGKVILLGLAALGSSSTKNEGWSQKVDKFARHDLRLNQRGKSCARRVAATATAALMTFSARSP